MDITGPQSSSSSNSKELLKMDFPNRDQFYSKYRHQDFAFQDSIMHYIAKNPKSVKLYQKLVQSCKYFFLMNPILILFELRYKSVEWETIAKAEDGWKRLDINNVTSKCWVTEKFYGHTDNIQFVSALIPKLYKCDSKRLNLSNKIITFDELLFLASNAEEIVFCGVDVKYEDGNLVPLEKVVETLPKIKNIEYWCTPTSPTSVTGKTFTELMKIPHFMTLDSFMLSNVPEEFDLDCFFIYMKKNKLTKIRFYFDDGISAAYKARIETIIDEIIATRNHDFKVPFIYFEGLVAEKRQKMTCRFHGI